MPKLDLTSKRWPPASNAGERVAIMDAFNSRQYTGGRYTEEVEQQMRDVTGAPYAVAFNSCTSAIHATVSARETYRVAAPAFTFAGTITGVGHVNLPIDFLDIDPDQLTPVAGMPEWLAACPKSITTILVDLHGNPHPWDRNQVVTDACQSLGTIVQIGSRAHPLGRHVGYAGTHCWSFSSAKLVAAPDGGAVTTYDRDEYELLRTLRDYGIPPGGSRSEDPVVRRDGHNWRPSELSMALVAARLDYLFKGIGGEPGLADRANRVGSLLHEACDRAGLWRQRELPHSRPAWHKIRIGPPNATRNPAGQVVAALMRDMLTAAGIPTHRWGRTPLNRHPAYWSTETLPVTELAALNTFCLGTEDCPPLTWSDSEIAYAQGVIEEVGKAVQ